MQSQNDLFFGHPTEWRVCSVRNQKFFDHFEQLEGTMRAIILRPVFEVDGSKSDAAAKEIVHFIGRLVECVKQIADYPAPGGHA